jgi:hypothetical protein
MKSYGKNKKHKINRAVSRIFCKIRVNQNIREVTINIDFFYE